MIITENDVSYQPLNITFKKWQVSQSRKAAVSQNYYIVKHECSQLIRKANQNYKLDTNGCLLIEQRVTTQLTSSLSIHHPNNIKEEKLPNQTTFIISGKKTPFPDSCFSNSCSSLKPSICYLRIFWKYKNIFSQTAVTSQVHLANRVPDS